MMFNPKNLFLTLILFVLIPLSFTPIEAQTATATLSGTITDPNSAVIPGVSITVQNDATSITRNATTNESGSFTISLLPPGKYTITAKRDGFTSVQVPDVVLNVGDQKAISIGLKVGDVNAAIEVRPDQTLVSTSPAVATTIDRQFVGNLPLNGRSFQSLILLTPGVVATPVTGSNVGQFSVNGQRANANYFTVDGVSANTGLAFPSSGIYQQLAGTVPGLTAAGTTSSLVSIDAMEEFKIQTSSYSAEYGRQPGGQVQLITRSGTNQYHGTAFDYLRNDVFDARNWFNKKPATKPPLRQNQFGGTFSGPVFMPNIGDGGPGWYNGKDRTFFFFSYEGLRLLLPTSRGLSVPSLRLRQIAPAALQPILNSIPLPTGPETTTATPCDPATDPACSPITHTKYSGTAPLKVSYSNPSAVDAYSIRIDHAANSKLTLFGRYNQTPSSSLSRSFSNPAILVGNRDLTDSLTLGSTQYITSRLSNEFRFNFSKISGRRSGSIDNFGGAVPADLSVLVSGYSGPGAKEGTVSISLPGAFSQVDRGDQSAHHQQQINLVDNISLAKGNHQLKFGFDYRRLAPIFGPRAYLQSTSFFSQAALLSATASSVIIIAAQGARPVFENWSSYAQDTWQSSRRLTVDWGLRWEINPAPHDASGKKPVLVTGVENLPSATLASPNAPIYKTFYTAFAPRVGLAYLLNSTAGRETVLRGGLGLFYDLGNGQAMSGFGGVPFVAVRVLSGVPFPLTAQLAQPPAFPGVTLPFNQGVIASNPRLTLPYTLQWNLGFERSLGKEQTITVSYVASAGRKLLTTQVLNNPLPTTGLRPNPNFASIQYTTNGATSDYQSLQLQYQRRLSRGLQALVNYTWSKAFDEVSSEFDPGNLERASADFDVRHNFKTALTYDIPKLQAGRIVTRLFRDWSADFILYAQSGQPIDLSAGDTFVRADGTQINVRPDVVSGVPFWVKDSNVPGGKRINPAAFQLPPVDANGSFIRQGTLGRNVVRPPGWYQVNMALRRQLNLTERFKLQVKAEAFNLLNHPIFSTYNVNFDPADSTFGVALSTLDSALGRSGSGLNPLYQIGGMRSMQFSLRLSF
jgi:hypothetical protein